MQGVQYVSRQIKSGPKWWKCLPCLLIGVMRSTKPSSRILDRERNSSPLSPSSSCVSSSKTRILVLIFFWSQTGLLWPRHVTWFDSEVYENLRSIRWSWPGTHSIILYPNNTWPSTRPNLNKPTRCGLSLLYRIKDKTTFRRNEAPLCATRVHDVENLNVAQKTHLLKSRLTSNGRLPLWVCFESQESVKFNYLWTYVVSLWAPPLHPLHKCEKLFISKIIVLRRDTCSRSETNNLERPFRDLPE